MCRSDALAAAIKWVAVCDHTYAVPVSLTNVQDVLPDVVVDHVAKLLG